MTGGGGEKVTLKLTAQYADLWNGLGTPEEYAHKSAVLTRWCQKLGRDPQVVERTVWMHAERVEAKPAMLDAYAAAGATHLIMGIEDPFPRGAVAHLLAWRARMGAEAA